MVNVKNEDVKLLEYQYFALKNIRKNLVEDFLKYHHASALNDLVHDQLKKDPDFMHQLIDDIKESMLILLDKKMEKIEKSIRGKIEVNPL